MKGREMKGREMKKGGKWKRAVTHVSRTGKYLLAAIVLRITRSALNTCEAPMNPTVQFFRAACSLNADETALIVVRFYSVTSRRSRWTDLLQSAFFRKQNPI